MGDTLLNGRPAEDFELADARRCDLERDLALLAGLLAEYPRAPEPTSRPVAGGGRARGVAVTGDCLCLNLGIECWCARRGPGGFGYRPHGTLAAARRHYRRGEPLCGSCKQAETRRSEDRWRREREQRPPELARAAPGAGRRIREMRQRAGMSQLGLAAALGVPQPTLSAWETGRYRPAVGVLARVAAVAQAGERTRAA